MAGLSASYNGDRVLQELVCDICNNLYHQPKTLPCCHTFCSDCLKKSIEAKKETEDQLNLTVYPCPVCRQPFDCTSNGLQAIKTNFKLANMVEAIKTSTPKPVQYCGKCTDNVIARSYCTQCSTYLCDFCSQYHEKSRDYRDHTLTNYVPPDSPIIGTPPRNSPISSSLPSSYNSLVLMAAEPCTKHRSQCLLLYCISCDEAICTVCKVLAHANCSVEYIEDDSILIQDAKKLLSEKFAVLCSSQEKIDVHLEKFQTSRAELEAKQCHLVKQIQTSSEAAVNSIRENEEELQKETSIIYKTKMSDFNEQINKIEILKDKVIQTLTLQETIDSLSNVKLLKTKKELINKIDMLLTTVNVLHLNVPDADIPIRLVMPDCPMKVGHLVEDISSFDAEVPSSISQGIEHKLLLRALNKNHKAIQHGGASVVPSISHAHDPSSPLFAEVTDNNDGTYMVRYIPMHHTPVTVSLGNDHEYTLNVVRSYTPLVAIPSEYHLPSPPYGVCSLSNNQLAITMQEKLIRIYDIEKKTVVKEIQSNFVRPYLMTVDKGSLWITDREAHNVQRYSLSDFKKTLHYGTKGKSVGSFQHPRGIAVHPTTGKVYIADMRNHRIQIFDVRDNATLIPVGAFGSEGKDNGQFDQPAGILFNQYEQLVVCDDRNCRLQVLDGEGRHIANFGVTAGSNRGTLCSPIGIAQDNHGRYVVGEFGSHLVTILDSQGDILSCVRSVNGDIGSLSHPRGVAVDENGFIYVADFGNKRVVRL